MTTGQPETPNNGKDLSPRIRDGYTLADMPGANVAASGGREHTGDIRSNVLTGMRDAYTLSATDDIRTSEVDDLIIDNFLNTIAEVALAVASREINGVNNQ